MERPEGGLTIGNDSIRVSAFTQEEKTYLIFETRKPAGDWRMLLSTGLVSRGSMWEDKGTVVHKSDPTLEWSGYSVNFQSGFLNEAFLDNNGKELVVRGSSGEIWPEYVAHHIEERITIIGSNQLHVTVTDTISERVKEVRLGKLMSKFYFIPDGLTQRGAEPLDFAWTPCLHLEKDHVIADHVFRSPATIVQYDGLYAALVPDLDLLIKHRLKIRHAMDLRMPDVPMDGENDAEAEVPRLYYGFCTWNPDGHVYYKHNPEQREIMLPGEMAYGFDLFLGDSDGPEKVVHDVNTHLWERYGHKYFEDIRPQVMPFENYGKDYAYPNELARTMKRVTINGKECVGIENLSRRGANFHTWENDLNVGFGIRHYADKWGDKDLRSAADGIRSLILNSPSNKGAFPCVYNFEEKQYEGSLYWTTRACDPINGFDTGAMGVSAWWLMYWNDNFGNDPETTEKVVAYADFLTESMLPSGAVPTFYFSDFKPSPSLKESGTAAISGAVLAKVAKITGDAKLKKAALKIGKFVDEQIMPKLKFYDFETIYSCSPKAYHFVDPVSGILPQNNLSVQWAADQFLALYKLTGDEYWLKRGELALGILSFYHQCWAPPHYSAYLYGGFGVMNTDGEWNDGRQARFVPTYADYYEVTGKTEYLERAISATRASF
ncbi:MAG: hypothetical protein WCO51_10275, partial [bacterium]